MRERGGRAGWARERRGCVQWRGGPTAGDESGSAMVEFVVVAVLMLVPLVYVVSSVARLRYTHAAGEHVGGLGVMASEVRS